MQVLPGLGLGFGLGLGKLFFHSATRQDQATFQDQDKTRQDKTRQDETRRGYGQGQDLGIRDQG